MINVNTASLADIARAQNSLASVLAGVTGNGLEEIITLATLQMLRFVTANIEVDTGRTKNSVFPAVRGPVGELATNVSYAPFVRESGHGKQFFTYAADVEGPAIAQAFGLEVEARVNRAF